MLKYITSNKEKIETARRNLNEYGIIFQELKLELVEIQSENILGIAINKAKQAFNKIKEPLFVTDHGWSIPALNGFPGPYMRYMNKWLSSQDFLNMIKEHDDKTIIKQEVLCYIDTNGIKYFTSEIRGQFLAEVKDEGLPAMRVITLASSGKSVAQCIQEGVNPAEDNSIWKDFVDYLKSI